MNAFFTVWVALLSLLIQVENLQQSIQQTGTASGLVISEIMYNPPDLNGWQGSQLEFVEFHNRDATTYDLSGVRLTDAIDFTFPAGTTLAAGEYLILASSSDGFFSKYGFRPYGVYEGQLSNGGEILRLVDAAGVAILVQPYGDDSSWPCGPDGGDFSLVLVNTDAPAVGSSWRISTVAGGSPGSADPAPPANLPAIVVNEVLAHTDSPLEDSVELFNPSEYDAHIGSWLLSDTVSEPGRYTFPEGFLVPAGGYAVVTESQFGKGDRGFRLSENGEEVVLTAANCQGETMGYRHVRTFGASPNGVSMGRYATSTGAVHFPLQAELTLGAVNGGPRINPVVISEIMYNPQPDGQIADEYVELHNTTDVNVPLYLPAFPWLTWRLKGVGDFAFPSDTVLGPYQSLLVVAIEPDRFRSRYSISPAIPIFGPYAGVLDNDGERLALLRPEPPNPTGPQPYVEVDTVTYSDTAPWPARADGQGAALSRLDLRAYGDDPINWRASDADTDYNFLPIVR